MAEIGKARKAGDRRRVRATHVVSTAHTGKSIKGNMMGRVSRLAEFATGTGGRNGRA